MALPKRLFLANYSGKAYCVKFIKIISFRFPNFKNNFIAYVFVLFQKRNICRSFEFSVVTLTLPNMIYFTGYPWMFCGSDSYGFVWNGLFSS